MSSNKETSSTATASASRSATAIPASFLLNQPIVIDNGTGSIKAGFAGSSKPKVITRTRIGRPKHMRIMPGGALEQESSSTLRSDLYMGSKLDNHRGIFKLEYPMSHGYINPNDWDSMERLWDFSISKKENLNAKMEEHPLLFTEAPLNPRGNRERIAEIFFETHRVPALYFATPSVLSLYASGRTTGIVLDVGEGLAHCVPVYEGFALPHSVTRMDVAGRDVTAHLQLLLRRAGLAFTTTAENDIARVIKEETCYVSSAVSSSTTQQQQELQYQLPDGQSITLTDERHLAPEILFNPSLIGSEEISIQQCLLSSISKSDIDLRSTLYQQMVLSGGSTLCPGFGDRLLYELRRSAPPRTKIRITAPNDRLYSGFVGGSILASLATFKNMWVTKSLWDEDGVSLLHRYAV